MRELYKTNYFMACFENFFSPQISAYRKNHNLQHVSIRLIEEWIEYFDKDFVVGAVLTDL